MSRVGMSEERDAFALKSGRDVAGRSVRGKNRLRIPNNREIVFHARLAPDTFDRLIQHEADHLAMFLLPCLFSGRHHDRTDPALY